MKHADFVSFYIINPRHLSLGTELPHRLHMKNNSTTMIRGGSSSRVWVEYRSLLA